MYHVTPRANVGSIKSKGILQSMSRSRAVGIWLCSESKIHRAVKHCSQVHNIPPSDFCVFEVQVKRRLMVRTKWRGIWRYRENIPADRVYWTGHYHPSGIYLPF